MDVASASGACSNLLARPGAELIGDLGRIVAAARAAFPVPSSRRRDLPGAVRDLSRLLTRERSDLRRPYWVSPRFAAAYLHYFLPWNVYRLAWLLPGLDLPRRPDAVMLDLGSGPLTLPLALWCARPELRGRPLTFICADTAASVLETGRDILRLLSGDACPWRIVLRRGPLEKSLARYAAEADCVMAGNVLNELPSAGRAFTEEDAARLMDLLASRLSPGGRVLLVEPGTRLGGSIIALARREALLRGLFPLAPCTHSAPCPMLAPFPGFPGRREEARAGEAYRINDASAETGGARRSSSWCHFSLPAADAPPILHALSREARLEKRGLSLSCLLLHKPVRGERTNTARHPALPLRVMSDCIRLPGETEPARYACCERGLALLRDAARVPSGGFSLACPPEREERDAKSGALLLRRAGA
jgi:SAM-dependent methyltransferase